MSKMIVVHLEDDSADARQLKRLFGSHIKPRLERSFHEYFAYDEPASPSKRVEADVDFELRQYGSVAALAAGLVDPDGHLTSDGVSCLFFILDYYVASAESDKPKALTRHRIGTEDLRDWLDARFPAVPRVVLTAGGDADIELDGGWAEYVNKDYLGNPEQFAVKLGQFFDKWWKPSFWLALRSYSSEAFESWHTPGHNAGTAFRRSPVLADFYHSYGPLVFQTDLSVSVDELGDLSEPALPSPLRDAQARSAAVFGADDSFYVTNGTSTSNKAMLMALLRPREVVLLDRNCHKSVHQAIVMSGALPLYLAPRFNTRLGLWNPLPLRTLEQAIKADYPEHLRPRLLVLTTSTYEGVLYPIDVIADWCDRFGILLHADEAWAPYLRFHPAFARLGDCREIISKYDAMSAGAHFSVQSTHKVLAAFSQASMVHVSPRLRQRIEDTDRHDSKWGWLRERFSLHGHGSYEKFRHELTETFRYWHSTSPHYPMLASLDRATLQMRLEGTAVLERGLQLAENLRHGIEDRIGRRCIVDLPDIVGARSLADFAGYAKDPLKVVVAGPTAEAVTRLKEALSSNRIRWEKSTRSCVEFIVTVGSYSGNVQNLQHALAACGGCVGIPAESATDSADFDDVAASGQVVVLPRDAAACEGELVPIQQCIGRVSAQMLVPYPPGIPVFLPGFKISKSMVCRVLDVVNAGGGHEVHGLLSVPEGHLVKVMKPNEAAKGMATLKKTGFTSFLQKQGYVAATGVGRG